ncbi:MAG: hypothetical protein JWO72_1956, partial [Caulobacteraceae bacterium]|nr:hypothetical protein [Caulobacteraceae bacterium]
MANGTPPSKAGARMLRPLIYDAAAAAAAFVLAYYVASGQVWASGAMPDLRPMLPGAAAFAIIAATIAYWQDQHRAVWRYTSLADAIRIVRVSFLTTLLFVPLLIWTPAFEATPRLAPVLTFFLMAALMAAPRVVARARADGRTPRPFTTHPRLNPQSVPVIVIGQPQRIE